MASYSVDDVINSTLYAKTAVKGLSVPSENSAIIRNFKPGDLIGTVYSYITHPDGLYWVIQYTGGYFYVKHEAGKFSTKALEKQGVKDVQTKQKEKELSEQTVLDKLKSSSKSLISSVTVIIIILLIVIVVIELNKRYHFLNK
jgi:hypothetical protein